MPTLGQILNQMNMFERLIKKLDKEELSISHLNNQGID